MTKLKGRGQLGDPTGLTVLPNGNVLVSDSQKSCIHVFESVSGKYQGKLDIMEIHQPDSPSGNLAQYNCIATVDSDAKVCLYVTTINKHYLQ